MCVRACVCKSTLLFVCVGSGLGREGACVKSCEIYRDRIVMNEGEDANEFKKLTAKQKQKRRWPESS